MNKQLVKQNLSIRELTSKEDLLKDMVKILNGEITKQDYINEINQWNKEREE